MRDNGFLNCFDFTEALLDAREESSTV